MDNYVKTRIKLEAFDKRLLRVVHERVKKEISQLNGMVKGPVPLPTKKRIYCVLRSPHVNKKSREHFEIRIYKLLLDVYLPKTDVELELIDCFKKIPPGISIKFC